MATDNYRMVNIPSLGYADYNPGPGGTNIFDSDLPTVESLGMPITMTPMDAIKFAGWYKDKFGHGPMGPQEWIQFGDLWKKESGYSMAGTTPGSQGSFLDQYLNERNNYKDETTSLPPGPTNNYVQSSVVDYSEDQLDEWGHPKEANEGDIFTDGEGNVYKAHTAQTVNEVGEVISEEIEWRPYTGSASPGSGSGFEITDIFDILSGKEGLEGDWKRAGIWGLLGQIAGGQFDQGIGAGLPGALGNILGIFGLNQGPVGDAASSGDWKELLKLLLMGKKDAEFLKDIEVPTGQMAAQSEIGKQWGLPTRESMVLQGLGPNYLQGQKYAMNLGQTTPAATHTVGMPYIEKGKHGGIMGIQQSYGDITPAFLEPGEFVFTKKATDNIGAKRLYKLMKEAEQMGMK